MARWDQAIKKQFSPQENEGGISQRKPPFLGWENCPEMGHFPFASNGEKPFVNLQMNAWFISAVEEKCFVPVNPQMNPLLITQISDEKKTRSDVRLTGN